MLNPLSRRLAFPLLALFSTLSSGLLLAQEKADGEFLEETRHYETSIAEIDAMLEEIESADPAQEARDQIIDNYKAAKDFYEQAIQEINEEQSLLSEAETATETIEKIGVELNSAASPVDSPDAAGLEKAGAGNLVKLEKRQDALRADRVALEKEQAAMAAKQQTLLTRPQAARLELDAAQDLREELSLKFDDAETATQATSSDESELERSSRWRLEAQYAAVLAQIVRLNAEVSNNSVLLSVVEAKQDANVQRSLRLDKQFEVLSEWLRVTRAKDAEAAVTEAQAVEQSVQSKHPLLQTLASENAAYTQSLSDLTSSMDDAVERLQKVDTTADDIVSRFEDAKRRVEIAGLSGALGEVLRDQRRSLSNEKRFRSDSEKRRETIANAGLQQLSHIEKRRKLLNMDAALQNVFEVDEAASIADDQRQALEPDARSLLQAQRDLLGKLGDLSKRYVNTLGELDFKAQTLAQTTTEYRVFLDEKLYWIPSMPVLGLQTLTNLWASFKIIATPANWLEPAQQFLTQLQKNAALAILLFVVVIALLAMRSRMLRNLSALAVKAGHFYDARFSHTFEALIMTLLLALPWGLLTYGLGWIVQRSARVSDLLHALAEGFIAVSLPLFVVLFLFWTLSEKGLALTHFRWRQATVLSLKRRLKRLVFVALPCIFITAAAQWYTAETAINSLGRLAFLLFALSIMYFVYRFLHPDGVFVKPYLDKKPTGWLKRVRFVWFGLALAIPLGFIGLAGAGYFYTTLQLNQRLVSSVWIVLVIILVRSLVVRWITIVKRELAIKKISEKREAAKINEQNLSAEGTTIAIDTNEIDINAVDAQSRHLLKTVVGWSLILLIWFVWSDTLPALNVLDSVRLWSSTELIDGLEQITDITLADILIALIIGVLVTAAARNLPGVLQMTILQMLPLQPSSRYAITTIVQYLIVMIGIIMIFGAIGVAWSQVQWLIAALGVGLGFGLQEIFANFVSGIILLFEKPIRIGDTVTIGALDGTVSKIRIRATTIVDFDNKEIIVPNKTFITQELINWTLSDQITRVIIPVGVAYGSDTQEVTDLIMNTITRHPKVLSEPAPQVFFLNFGDSSLNFEVRIYVSQLGDRLPVTHDVHIGIQKALAERGIEIPFPQRDLFIKPGSDLTLLREKNNGESTGNA